MKVVVNATPLIALVRAGVLFKDGHQIVSQDTDTPDQIVEEPIEELAA